MTRRTLVRALGAWVALTVIGSCTIHEWARIDHGPVPDRAARRWALAALEAGRLGEAVPEPPESARGFRADGPIVVLAWARGRPWTRHVGASSLVDAVEGALDAFRADERLVALPAFSAPRRDAGRVRFTLEVARGEGPMVLGVPWIESLGLVPLHDGLHVSVDGDDAWATPAELHAGGSYDTGVRTPIPELTVGLDVGALVDRLAREMGHEAAEVHDRGSVRRFRVHTVAEHVHPRSVAPTEAALREAAVEGAEFLLRHQRPDGTFTYVYDARSGGARPEEYNLPRHSGATYFLAQVHNLNGMPEAREGARRALEWVRRTRVRHCGGPDLWCVEAYGRVELGATALTALAAAEYLAGGDDPAVRMMLERLTAHIRSMQRDDGEMMHEWDLAHDRPIDVQYLYYSGEAAFAMLRAHAVIGDERDLDTSRRLMRHLTGEGWDFFGSRYYYGEEHWTCIAAGEASDRIESPPALDFCGRWAAWNRKVQFGPGETPWASSGAYGVGPLLLPRLTPVASRTEAFISTYQMAHRAGADTTELRAQIERGLGMLLRWRWDPGPVHLFADPIGARGGLPGSPTELFVRNDYVQHACSAMVRWADLLAHESGPGRR